MGLLGAVKDPFHDVIEYVDQSNKLIVSNAGVKAKTTN